jgi:hypothetical protein
MAAIVVVAVDEARVCEVTSLVDELVDEARVCEVATLADELTIADSMSPAICEALKTTSASPLNVHVLSSDRHPVVFSPQVKVLSSPASLQGVIAIPALGLSIHPEHISQMIHRP